MITVRFIEYWNDYRQMEKKKRFTDLGRLADWIFGQMQVDYTKEDNRYALYFPKCETISRIERISMTPSNCGPTIWIKLIDDDCRGILFSDGTFTAGRKHCTGTVRNWLAECEERRKHPMFNFAKDGSDTEETMEGGSGDSGSVISIDIIKEAAYAIHQAGGCGAEDRYAKGFDAAIDLALDILLKKIGLTVHEVIDYGEMQEA